MMFHMIILVFLFYLNKIKNIINPKSLDVRGIPGIYYSSRHPIFEQYDVENVEYILYLEVDDINAIVYNWLRKNQNELIRELIAHI
uniref:hypothetical protein n=1 Tax=Gracilaria cervicornis TaxID=172960 RepID=UPI001D11706C|nr:hypothetical protein LK223_pgp002 [Gracilaria cervicornis]UAD84068.1 hypothetical protein [Gracilaria cervicornis]